MASSWLSASAALQPALQRTFGSAGTTKWKIVSAARTKSSIAGSVSFARSSSSRSLRVSAATSLK